MTRPMSGPIPSRPRAVLHDIPYYSIIGMAHGWFRAMDFRFHVTGQEHIPRTGGAVLAVNHISYVDFIMAG